jgi:hypothetical protein
MRDFVAPPVMFVDARRTRRRALQLGRLPFTPRKSPD